MTSEELLNDEATTEEVDEIITIPRYLISSYGADYDVEGLVKRMKRGDIFVPDFQRNYVWDLRQASQFIESILMRLPVPGIILALDDSEMPGERRKMYIVDGLQRLTTLESFLDGQFPDGKVFKLRDVAKEFEGKAYTELSPDDQRDITDYLLHATIIRQEEPDQDRSGIYFVFRRLNTNGTPLTPQEIRSAIYRGRFNELLESLADYPAWTEIYRAPKGKLRKNSEELILRFFALYYQKDQYHKPMETFLNNFMSANSDLQDKKRPEISESGLQELFTQTIDVVFAAVGKDAFRLSRTFNTSVFDAVMVGLAGRLERGPIHDSLKLKERYEQLIVNPQFQEWVSRKTTDVTSVKSRIAMAVESFQDVD